LFLADYTANLDGPNLKKEKGKIMEGKRILIGVMVMFMLGGACFTSSAQETPGTNLVINGSFENGMNNWGVEPGHNPERVSLDNSTSTDSERSLKSDGTATDTPLFIATNQFLNGKLKPSQAYILKADIRRTTNNGKISVALLEKPAEKTYNEWTYHWCGANSEKGLIDTWEHFELEFKTNPKVDNVIVILYNLFSGGIAWFDNIQLTEVSGEK
jgi:hypothetical protein